MRYTSTDFQWGPSVTPTPLTYLIAFIATISIGSTLFNDLFNYFGLNGPESFLGLSWYGIKNFYIWQPFTYFFTQGAEFTGISISYLIHLSFNLYLLWMLGASVIERIGIYSFFKLYFTGGVIPGLAGLFLMKLTSSYMILNGTGAPILALFTFWALLFNEAEIRLFLLFPIKTSTLLLSLFIAIFVIYLSQADFISLIVYITAMLTGYLYALIGYRLRSPFNFLKKFEDFVLNFFKKPKNEKIIDISGEMDDEHFVDAMLAKISKNGEGSLSYFERQRLDKISKFKK